MSSSIVLLSKESAYYHWILIIGHYRIHSSKLIDKGDKNIDILII